MPITKTELSENKRGSFINSPIALGDSFTLGTGASVVEKCYVRRLSAINNVTIQNQGIGGVGVWRECFQHFSVAAPSGNINPTTWLCGFNDVRRSGDNNSTYEKIKGCLKSVLVNTWLSSFSPASAVTNTGSWFDYSGAGGKCEALASGSARYSITSGDTLTYVSPKSSNIVIGVFNSDGTVENNGRFTVTIDGVLVETFNPNGKTDGISDLAYNNNITQNVLVYENLKDTTHTVVVTLLDAKTTIIDYFGVMGEPNINPAVFVLDVPKMTATGYTVAPNNANDHVIDMAIAAQDEVISMFPYRPVIKIKTNNYFNLLTDVSVDNVHPNDSGHANIALAIQTAIKTNSDFLVHGNRSNLTNTVIGDGAAKSNTSGDGNTVYGKDAMMSSTVARQCIAIGQEAMKNATGTADYNTAVGFQALMSLIASTNNTAFGFQCLKALTNAGSQNTAFGHIALAALVAGYNNVAIGALAMNAATNAGFNVVIGADAYKLGTGSSNTVIGYGAGRDSTGSGNVFLGKDAGQTEMGNNKLIIENSNAAAGSRLIEGDFSTRELTFDASVKTKQPSVNGAGKWKLGKLVTSAVTPDATRYVEVDIDGIVYKLIIAS